MDATKVEVFTLVVSFRFCSRPDSYTDQNQTRTRMLVTDILRKIFSLYSVNFRLFEAPFFLIALTPIPLLKKRKRFIDQGPVL